MPLPTRSNSLGGGGWWFWGMNGWKICKIKTGNGERYWKIIWQYKIRVEILESKSEVQDKELERELDDLDV